MGIGKGLREGASMGEGAAVGGRPRLLSVIDDVEEFLCEEGIDGTRILSC